MIDFERRSGVEGTRVKLPRPLLPGFFRFLTRGLGTRETASPDILSLLMFQADYLGRLIELGEADADARADEIQSFIENY